MALWILNLVRRGRLYVGYGIVVLGVLGLVTIISSVSLIRGVVSESLYALYPNEPIAVIGLASLFVLLVYVLHQLSVLSDRIATLTQELAIRNANGESTRGSHPPKGEDSA